MKEYRKTAKEIVEFLYSGGDLTSEFQSNKRALEGSEAHRYLQNKYKEEDRKEVSVETLFEHGDVSFHITGRMDGLLVEDNKLIVEEIKSTKTDLNIIDIDSRPEHLMQAKMYAYMYAKQQEIKSIYVRLTYITVDDYTTKSFEKRYHIGQLERFFERTMIDYIKWIEIFDQHQQAKLKSIEGITFPFDDYREGQRKFMGAVYQTLIQKDILYSVAPTGIGKTIAALFSSLKTIKNEREKIFYLTAKNAGKTIVVDTVNLLKEHGLKAKTTVLNSKENMCMMDTVDCDPDICPYAKGFFDRLKDGLEDIFVHDDVYDMKLIKDYGEFHKICPHEFSLEISNYSDIVICDYNYAFDPRSKLIRYFEEDYYQPKILVDEAHNMVDRSRSMYSASLRVSDLDKLKKATKGIKPSVQSHITKLLKHIDQFVIDEEIEKARFHYQFELDNEAIKYIERVINKLDNILSEHKKHPKRKEILDGYFVLNQFLKISDFFNDRYRYIVETDGEDVILTLACMDASKFILQTIEERVQGIVFFSATLNPLDYYVTCITNKQGLSIQIPSPFTQNHLGLYVDQSTSTRYRDRARSIPRIIDTIYAMAETKIGNYIVFFPSYQYMEMVLKEFSTDDYDVIVQSRGMTVSKRNEVLESFDQVGEQSTIGFFVLGGSFSEGIDYVGDKLSGVLVVGVALPQFNRYNELLRSYYDDEYNDGFHYTYTYPGMNKVIQAVGRVIRRNEDTGIAILLDDRYTQSSYLELYPRHWSHFQTIRQQDHIQSFLEQFWEKNN